MTTLPDLKEQKKAERKQRPVSIPASALSGKTPLSAAQRAELEKELVRRGAMAAPKVAWDPKDNPPGWNEKASLRGGARALWESKDFLLVLAGPSETGKTWGALKKVNALLWKYPGAQWVMLRKTYSSCITTCLQTYKRIIGDNSPIKAYGGEKPEWYDYPNGSRLWIGGLDNLAKVLSGERDGYFINQGEELTLDEIETITTRATGRGSVMPYTQIVVDANPGPPDHWIKNRAGMTLLQSYHEDNPTLWDYAPEDVTECSEEWPDTSWDGRVGRWTAQGKRTLSILDALTGLRYSRLRKGLWVQAEGAVYEFDANIHTVPDFQIPSTWKRYRVIDFGFTNPFVCLWAAVDPDGRIFVYREIYITEMLVSELARQIRNLSADEKFEATICDHDAEDRATLAAEGIKNIAAWKSIKPGIDAVARRLQVVGDGKPRLMFLRGCLDVPKEKWSSPRIMPDPNLVDKKLPYSTVGEFGFYVWPKDVSGKPNKEMPVDEFNHGQDCTRYLVVHIDQIGKKKIRAA